MNDNTKYLISKLQEKISQLISDFSENQKELLTLKTENINLKKDLENLNRQLKEKTQLYNSLRIARAFAVSDDERSEAKQKIKKILREIDNCIALMNE